MLLHVTFLSNLETWEAWRICCVSISFVYMILKLNHPRFNFAIMYVALKFSRFGVGQKWLGVRVVLIV
jgi:hypothetical protein